MTCVKKLILAVLLSGALLLLPATIIPAAFTEQGNPSLYKDLSSKAEENLKKLDSSQRKSYKQMLREQDDILMAYLLAYESDATLQQANPKDVLSNYLQVRSYLNRYGTEHPTEFFLAYVADQTVSDERIQAYRDGLLRDGLREILESAEGEMDLYRKVAMWCNSRLVFQQTSGRDQSPLDITQKSLYGRCEEMQILFVAAARTVGLPARPASTPWWAHSDNNHAWAEVWLEGAWHYTGDMDGAYYPDQTWFSGMIDKTVLILADGSLPSERDEVLVKGRYDCTINSIRNYAGERTRKVEIRTLDAAGQPLPETYVGVMVYNWGALRPLTFIQTDKEGKFSLSVGRGAFYLSASKDSLQALQLIPSGDVTELACNLVLSDAVLPDQDALLSYPSNPFTWKDSPQVWVEGVRAERQRWQEQNSRYGNRFPEFADSLLGEFAVAVRGNYSEFARFLKGHPILDGEFMAYVLSNDPQYIDSKFLWQATAEQFEALYWQFQAMEYKFDYDELASVINPTVFYEELAQPVKVARKFWYPYPKKMIKKGYNRLERLNVAMTWLKKKYQVNPAKALQGLLPLDVLLKQKYLTAYQYRILAVYLARANAIPTEFSRLPNLIFVRYDNGDWGYYDLEKCAPEADVEDAQAFVKLKVSLSDEFGAPVAGAVSSLELSRFQDGTFYGMDQNFVEQGSGSYALSVPKGAYYLNFGYRVSDSKTAFQMRHLDFSELDSLQVEFVAREYPRNWGDVPSDIAKVLEEYGNGESNIILLGNIDRENSRRIADKLQTMGKAYIWIGYDEAPQAPLNYRVSELWQNMVSADQRNSLRTVTLVRKDGKWQSYEGLWERLSE